MPAPQPAPSNPVKPTTQDRPRIFMGEINLSAFYHEGAVAKAGNGSHVLLLDSWGPLEGPNGRFGVKVIRCTPEGVPLPDASEGVLENAPATYLTPLPPTGTSAPRSFADRRGVTKRNPWEMPVTLVKSLDPQLPAGISSADASLTLVPFGPHFGKALGQLNDHERRYIAKNAKNAGFKRAAETANALPGVNERGQSVRLSDAGMRQLLQQQGELIRSIPLVTVIEQYCGYAPEEVVGKLRKYRIGSEFINLNTEKNSFGSLNGFEFKTLKKSRGSSNNSMDIVAAAKEMEGSAVDFKAIRNGIISHFSLQPQLDRMFEDALKREQDAIRSGKPVEYAPSPSAKVDGALKDAEGKKVSEEVEVPFDLATGVAVGSTDKDRGGGFCEREDLWPTARNFLVEERKLDPALIDYLYQNRNLYAARREFPASANLPYKSNYQDIIVAPVFGFKTGAVVGVDTKPLPRKPGEKTEGRNHGKTGQGAFMFGTWGPQTKRVILTEGFIKGIAFFQLHRKALKIGEETCVMARSGAKPTLEIIPQLKEWGAEAIVAYDNDFTGRDKAKKFHDECGKQGVPCQMMFVEPSEVTVSISKKSKEGYHDAARATEIETAIIKFAESKGIKWQHENDPKRPDVTSIRLPNTDEIITHIEEHLKDDRRLSGKEFQARAKGLSDAAQQKLEKVRWLKLDIHHKDWDDIVKKGPLQQCLKEPVVDAPHVPVSTAVPSRPSVATVPIANTAGTLSPSEAVNVLTHITNIAMEMRSRMNAAGIRVPAEVDAKLNEVVAAKGVADATPRGDAKAVETPAVEDPANAALSPTKALLVSRTAKDKTVIYSVGTPSRIYDVPLTPDQQAKAGSLLEEELPRQAEIIDGDKPRLIGISDVDGRMIDVRDAVGAEVELTPAPEAVQRAWQNPKNPSVIDALQQLRREYGLPVPSPVPEPAPKGAEAMAQT